MTVKEFFESGLAGLINALILWPRGLSFAYVVDESGGISESHPLLINKLTPAEAICDLDDDGVLQTRLVALMHWDEQRIGEMERNHARAGAVRVQDNEPEYMDER